MPILQTALAQLRGVRSQVKTVQVQAKGAAAEALAAFDQKAQAIEGRPAFGPGGGGAVTGGDTLNSVAGSLGQLMNIFQGADVGPTAQATSASTERKQAAAAVLGKFKALTTADLAALNATLKTANLEPITVPAGRAGRPSSPGER